MKRSIDKVNPVIFGVKTNAGDGRHYNCHTKGNRSKKHDDMVGLRNFKNRKFIILKQLFGLNKVSYPIFEIKLFLYKLFFFRWKLTSLVFSSGKKNQDLKNNVKEK